MALRGESATGPHLDLGLQVGPYLWLGVVLCDTCGPLLQAAHPLIHVLGFGPDRRSYGLLTKVTIVKFRQNCDSLGPHHLQNMV